MSLRLVSGHLRWPVAAVVVLLAVVGGVSAYFHLNPATAVTGLARVAAASVFRQVYGDDLRAVNQLRARYWVGAADLLKADALASWRRLEREDAALRLVGDGGARPLPAQVPFVYESPDAPYLRELVQTYALRDVIAGAVDEYDAMLRLGGWLGRQFDHGGDRLKGSQDRITPVEVIRTGQNGRKFWCEVAARLTVHAASALGWQARLVSASRDGYAWEHAVADVWSNQYRKWFVLDTDFNVVYEVHGVPQSAFELCQYGPALQQSQQLRVRPIGAAKPSLPPRNLLPFYAYIHIDLRNDWNSRFLRRGSPVSGDQSTWWTARPELGPLLTAKTRVDQQGVFDWPVNAVSIHARELVRGRDGRLLLRLGLTGYSPVFRAFQVSVDSNPWEEAPGGAAIIPVFAGRHVVRGRIVTASGDYGPTYEVSFDTGR
jgi:hypothetical protein